MTSIFTCIPSDKTILILTSYRTGSTALCDLVSTQHNLINCGELFHFVEDPSSYTTFKHKNIVLKIMPDQIPPGDYWNDLIDKSYVIGLYRNNIAKQIASFYISHRTRKWHFEKKDSLNKDYNVEIDLLDLEDQIRYILKMNSIYHSYFKKFIHIELSYETLYENLAETNYQVNAKPNNYIEIVDTISKLLPNIYDHSN
jgi:LPS sulfotransferase NodH